MSNNRPTIPDKIKNVLWARAAGRCEFDGCNELLCEDWLTGKTINGAQIAHILPVANSARAKDGQTEDQKIDINNLMLICYKHHNLIDKSAPEDYPEDVLLEMKKKHEDRIRIATGVCENKQTLIVLYGANIEKDTPLLSYRQAQQAISPEFYIADGSPVRIQIHSEINEDDLNFVVTETKNLDRSIKNKVLDRIDQGEVEHVSLFALAPQYLLVKLGTILNEKYPIRVFQKIRVPDTWRWQSSNCELPISIIQPTKLSRQPVIVFALSGYDIIDRTVQYYKDTASIWTMTTNNPNMNLILTEDQLFIFKDAVRRLFEEISTITEYDSIHIHMALSNSCAIEVGRVWMPKVHKDLVIYESTKSLISEKIKISYKQ